MKPAQHRNDILLNDAQNMHLVFLIILSVKGNAPLTTVDLLMENVEVGHHHLSPKLHLAPKFLRNELMSTALLITNAFPGRLEIRHTSKSCTLPFFLLFYHHIPFVTLILFLSSKVCSKRKILLKIVAPQPF